MTEIVLLGGLVFIVALFMTMAGKGGGNFYVVILALAGVSMGEAAATGQFVLFCGAAAAVLVFHQKKSVSWPLAIIVGPMTSISALVGGYFSFVFSGFTLKMVFSVLLFLSGVLMLFPVSLKNQRGASGKRFGQVVLKIDGKDYKLDLRFFLPAAVITGFCSGMVGVSGGSFLVPLMVLAGRFPVKIAVGTSSFLIGATAFMGFVGHAAAGDFNADLAVPLSVAAVCGGLLGGKMTLLVKTRNLKKIFAYSNWLAGLLLLWNVFRGSN